MTSSTPLIPPFSFGMVKRNGFENESLILIHGYKVHTDDYGMLVVMPPFPPGNTLFPIVSCFLNTTTNFSSRDEYSLNKNRYSFLISENFEIISINKKVFGIRLLPNYSFRWNLA